MASAKFFVQLDMGSNKIVNVADPTSAQDAATKAYVDSSIPAGVSFATPSIGLGTAAAAGIASTVIRSDSTLLAFDATSPTTQAFGDSAAVGAATVAARRDHKHAMPATPVTSINKTGSTALTGAVTLTGGSNVTLTQSGQDISIASTGGAGTTVATDTIWDAAGDLVVGTGSDTAAKLSLGASGKVPRSNGSTLAYAFPPGYELDYVETTSALTITATSDATAQAFVTGNSISLDGSTKVIVEIYALFFASTVATVCNLYDGSTDLGRVAQINGSINVPLLARRIYTPSNASHTFSARFWKTSGTASVTAGAGGTATNMPGYIRVTIA